VAAFFVGIRSVLRFVYLRNTGAEDYMILIALIFSIGFTAFCVARKFYLLLGYYSILHGSMKILLMMRRETAWPGKTCRVTHTRAS
jgi:hypothetical protein